MTYPLFSSLKEDAIGAKAKLDQSVYKGRRLQVTFAQPKHKKEAKGEKVYDEDMPVDEASVGHSHEFLAFVLGTMSVVS